MFGLFSKYSQLRLFQVLFAVVLAWILCVILTAAGAFKEGHPARTDKMASLLYEAPWFRVPYPGVLVLMRDCARPGLRICFPPLLLRRRNMRK